MSHPKPRPRDVFDLVHDFVTASVQGELADADIETFERLLRDDVDARRLYARYIETTVRMPHMLAMLENDCGSSVKDESFMEPDANPAGKKLPILNLLSHARAVGGDTPQFRAFMWVVLAVSSVLTVAVTLLVVLTIFMGPPSHWIAARSVSHEALPRPDAHCPAQTDQPAPQPTMVGSLSDSGDDLQWAEGSSVLHKGERLASGARLRLKKGLAKITFDNGAKAVLEGPCDLKVESARQMFVTEGKLVILAATPQARGFTVHTAKMHVVDLGTEFAVEVRPDGVVETHVFQGRVEARATGAPTASSDDKPHVENELFSPVLLTASQAMVFNPQGSVVVRQAAKPAYFVRDIVDATSFPLSGTGVGLGRGMADPFWEIIAVSTDPGFKPRQAVIARPIQRYVSDSRATGQWISLTESLAGMPPDCRVTFRTKFDLTGFDPATAKIEGEFGVDDHLVGLRLNGKSLPVSASSNDGDLGMTKTPLRIDQGFVAGVNTLEVVIENQVGLVALLVDWRGTARRMLKP